VGDLLRVHDRCVVAADVTPVFQLHVPVPPVVQGDGTIVAGALRVTPLQPVTINVVSMAGGDFSRGDRIELTAATGVRSMWSCRGSSISYQ
jgi:hypothetical protein